MPSSWSEGLARPASRLLLACVLDVVLGRLAHADGFLRDGMGPIPAGRGATNVAHADNGSVLLDNPAALAGIEPAAMADLHLGQYLFAFRYSDAENAFAAGTGTPLPIADVAYVARSETSERLGYGFGLFVPAGFGADYELGTSPVFGPGRHAYRSFAAFAKLVAGVGYRATDRLSVGAHLGLAGSYVELRLPYWVQTGRLAGTPVGVRIRGIGFAPAWAIGAQWAAAPGTVLGASYTAPSDFEADVAGRARIDLAGTRDEFDSSIALGLPRAVAVGFRHDVGPRSRLSGEVTWRNWSAAFDRIRFELTRGKGALGVTNVGDQVHLGWKDTYTVGLGYELYLTPEATVRLGYTHHPSPVPDSTLTPVIPVTLEHVLALGFGWRIGEAQLDLSYQYTFGPTRHVARSSLVGGDHDASSLTVDGHAWFVGFIRHWRP
ncbi:MAG: outer membrane protein transport protein [Thermodesulfobacteriota bacterium]